MMEQMNKTTKFRENSFLIPDPLKILIRTPKLGLHIHSLNRERRDGKGFHILNLIRTVVTRNHSRHTSSIILNPFTFSLSLSLLPLHSASHSLLIFLFMKLFFFQLDDIF